MADTTYVRNSDRADRIDRVDTVDNGMSWVVPAIIVLVVLALGIWALSRANNGQSVVPAGSVTPNTTQSVTPNNTGGSAGASQTTGAY